MKLWAALGCACAILAASANALGEEPWCASGLESLPGDVCHHAPSKPASRRTLVIFLHGLIKAGSGWQYNQQRGFALLADRFGFTVLMPRGRAGATRSVASDTIGWPTSQQAQAVFEDEVLAEWRQARALLEQRDGKFDEVFVMGFSNGAYYAASLALRNRLEIDGYAAFAGGSAAAAGMQDEALRRPIFLGIASKDKTTLKDMRNLSARLRKLDWPHKAEERRVGHTVSDAHLAHALAYLRKKAQ